jgi:predicted nucleic acid-binding protein
MRYLLDTNVLVYLIDSADPKRQARAGAVFSASVAAEAACSAQALSEFASVALRKFTPHLTPRDVSQIIQKFDRILSVYPVTPATVLEALRGCDRYQFSFFDAQMWATARLHQVPVILTEDGNDGALMEGVRYVNPFSENFDLESIR